MRDPSFTIEWKNYNGRPIGYLEETQWISEEQAV